MAMLRIRKKYFSFLAALLVLLALSFYNSSLNTFIPRAATPPTPVPDPGLFKIVRVIDGDTVELESGQKVRYIGVDTPETKSPTKGVQCFGREAKAKNKELVEGKYVKLEKDISETDRYGRLLRYVYLPLPNSTNEAVFINKYLVKNGYAHAATFPPDVRFSEEFTEDERIARENNLGLWSYCR